MFVMKKRSLSKNIITKKIFYFYLYFSGIFLSMMASNARDNSLITKKHPARTAKKQRQRRDGGQPAADACEHRSPGGGIFYPEAAPLTVLRYYHRHGRGLVAGGDTAESEIEQKTIAGSNEESRVNRR